MKGMYVTASQRSNTLLTCWWDSSNWWWQIFRDVCRVATDSHACSL